MEATRADMARRWMGREKCEEVWFGEVALGPDLGFWFRYTILDGARGAEPLREAAAWAVLFRRTGVTAAKRKEPLDRLSGAVFTLGDLELGAEGCSGSAGELAWKLSFTDRGRRHAHVPSWMFRVGIASRDYRTAFLDLRCTGEVRLGNERFSVDDAPGVIGHIYGRRHGLYTWAWAHCNAFDGAPDVVFEGLSARLDLGGRPSPRLLSLVLWVDGERHSFSVTRTMLGAESSYGEAPDPSRKWRFAARSGRVSIEGEAELPEAATALVAYTDTDGSTTWCRNSRLSSLRVRFTDQAGQVREFSSQRSAFELGGRPQPAGQADLQP